MDNNSVEKCLEDFDILHHIFKLLNFNDQLNLTRMREKFREVVIKIWKSKYKKLKVLKTSNNYILTTRSPSKLEFMPKCHLVLSVTDFEEFFKINAENILELYVCKETEFNCKEIKFKLTHKLVTLVQLTFFKIQIQNADLEELNENCPVLETLCLFNCYNRYYTMLPEENDINIAAVENLPKLKCLEIHNSVRSAVYLLQEIFEKLKLRKVTIDAYSLHNRIGGQDEDCKTNRPSSLTTYPCEELYMEGITQTDLNKFSASFLHNLKNLNKLTIAGGFACKDHIVISDKFIETLSKICVNLKYLKLRNCRIKNCNPLPSLNELIFENCSDLTWDDLKYILSDLKLKSFTSLVTKYAGTFQYYKVSETLEELNYENIDSDKFMQLLEMDEKNFKNLTTLKWKSRLMGNLAKNITTYCPNLQILKIWYNFLYRDLSNLKYLIKLYIISSEMIKQTDLLTLLKHTSLRYLKINCYYMNEFVDEDYEEDDQLNQLMLNNDDNTNLLLLDIDIKTFMKFEYFWLGLVERNHKLNLRVSFANFDICKHVLRKLKNHPVFPKRLKYVKINGFSIDCNELKENFNETLRWMEPLMEDSSYFENFIIF